MSSGLTKKTVFADRTLSTLLSVQEGELVSYAQLSKGLHKYIKDNDLKNPNRKVSSQATQPLPPPGASQPTVEPAQTPAISSAESSPSAAWRKCRDCGADIPAQAAYCDLCGVQQ